MLGGAHARSIIAASPSHCQLLLILRILRSFLGVSICPSRRHGQSPLLHASGKSNKSMESYRKLSEDERKKYPLQGWKAVKYAATGSAQVNRTGQLQWHVEDLPACFKPSNAKAAHCGAVHPRRDRRRCRGT